MSNPENILNKFRSYSYHHILVACDSTSTAEALASSTDITLFQHPQEKFTPKTIQGGQYVVLINGTTDTQFSIKSAKWSTVMVPDTKVGGETFYQTMEIDGELVIMEPSGVRFLNVLSNVCNELQRDPTSVIYLLKTIFVGHSDTGETELIPNTKPFFFMIIDITAIIDIIGAEYTFAIVGISNGAGKLPSVASITDGFSYDIKDGSSLNDALRDLFYNLNSHYSRYKQRIQRDAESNGIKIDFSQYQDVIYEIEVDEHYKQAHFKAGTNELPQATSKGKNDVIISQGASIGIEELIDLVMKSSREVVREQSGNSQYLKGQKATYKITSTILSTPDSFKVVYHVHWHPIVFQKVQEDTPFSFEPPDGQGLELDYIFTGKNVDIKQFDIRMNMGYAFFQVLNTSNNLPSSKNVMTFNNGNSTLSGPGEPLAASPNGKPRAKVPLYLGMAIKDLQWRNKKFPVDTANYNVLLSRWAGYENISCKVVIRGNPQLLGETTLMPSEMSPSIERVDTLDGTQIVPNINKVPGFVKINIMMPSNDEYGDYATKFWYQGWYKIMSVNNVFEDGEFSQELELISLPFDAGQLDNSDNPGRFNNAYITEGADGSGVVDTELKKTVGQKSDERATSAKITSPDDEWIAP